MQPQPSPVIGVGPSGLDRKPATLCPVDRPSFRKCEMSWCSAVGYPWGGGGVVPIVRGRTLFPFRAFIRKSSSPLGEQNENSQCLTRLWARFGGWTVSA